MNPIQPPMARQSGQAIAEFLVAVTLVMSVLLLAIAMLGKFNDVRNKALAGARYVTWERTVWLDSAGSGQAGSDANWFALYGSAAQQVAKSDVELRNEYLQRGVAGNGAPIAGGDRGSAQLPATQQAMWTDYGGQHLLGASGDASASTSVDESPAAALAQYTAASFGSVQTQDSGTYNATMDLPTHNLQSGTFSVTIAKNSDALTRLWQGFGGLTFSDRNVLLANTWLPDGSGGNRALFSKAVPATQVALVRPSLYLGLQKYAPEITTLEFGRVKPDVVPADRLYVAPNQ